MRVSSESGTVVHLSEQDSGAVCLDPPFLSGDTIPEYRFDLGSCYRARASPSPFLPGERLELEVAIPDGRVLTSASRVPGAFSFEGLSHDAGQCRLEPDTNYRFRWTPAEDTWIYLADARIEGLPEALADREVEAPDSLYLLGLSIGREDTDIVFPRQFGFFDFFEEENRDLIPDPARGSARRLSCRDRVSWLPTATGRTGSGAGISTLPARYRSRPCSATGRDPSVQRRSGGFG